MNNVSFYIDSTNRLTINEIALKSRQDKFGLLENYGELIGVGKYNFWFEVNIRNVSNIPQEIIFEIAIARLDSFKIYKAINQNYTLEGICYGIGTDIANKPLKSYSHALKVEFPAKSTQKLFFVVNKFPGSIRSSIIAYHPTTFERRQRTINSGLSFYIALVIIVLISSFLLGIYSKKIDYFIFFLLVLIKTLLNLQLFNYTQVLQNFGFASISTSVSLMVTFLLQYLFFKLYFREKTPAYIFSSVAILAFTDFAFGSFFQPIKQYYYFQYFCVALLGFLFIYEIYKKTSSLKRSDYPFIITQILSLIILIGILSKHQISFANNFFRKYDFDLMYALSIFEVAVYLFYLLYNAILMNKDIGIKSQMLAQLQSKIISIQEYERKQIAIDLHDDLGSTLSVLKDKILNESPNSDTKNLINKAIKDLRSISHNLLPPDLETFGFIPSIEKYISLLNDTGLKLTLIVFGEKQKFNDSVELNLYRILIEILNNIKKHSETRIATIQLIYHSDYLHVSVEEEKPKKITEKGNGIGEKSISSRLEYLHARVLENGTGENGYSYIFEVPYDQNPNR